MACFVTIEAFKLLQGGVSLLHLHVPLCPINEVTNVKLALVPEYSSDLCPCSVRMCCELSKYLYTLSLLYRIFANSLTLFADNSRRVTIYYEIDSVLLNSFRFSAVVFYQDHHVFLMASSTLGFV